MSGQGDSYKEKYENGLKRKSGSERSRGYRIRDLERAMQKTMDEYAGGIKTDYKYTGHGLDLADERIKELAGDKTPAGFCFWLHSKERLKNYENSNN